MFGDVLTDEASVITGSIGMLPIAKSKVLSTKDLGDKIAKLI